MGDLIVRGHKDFANAYDNACGITSTMDMRS